MVAAFVATSALCGFAWSAESLIAFRVLQGLAGGMIMPIGMITLAQAAGPQRDRARDERRRRADAARARPRAGHRRRCSSRTCRGAGSSSSTCRSASSGSCSRRGCCRAARAEGRAGRRPGAAGLARPAGALARRRARGLRAQRGLDARLGDARRGCCRARRRRLSSPPSCCARWRTPAPLVDVRLFARARLRGRGRDRLPRRRRALRLAAAAAALLPDRRAASRRWTPGC